MSVIVVVFVIIILYLRLIKKHELIINLVSFHFSECFNLFCRQDYWRAGPDAGRPTLDTTESLTLMGANETDGYTMVDFMRPANSMEAQDVAIMVGRDT